MSFVSALVSPEISRFMRSMSPIRCGFPAPPPPIAPRFPLGARSRSKISLCNRALRLHLPRRELDELVPHLRAALERHEAIVQHRDVERQARDVHVSQELLRRLDVPERGVAAHAAVQELSSRLDVDGVLPQRPLEGFVPSHALALGVQRLPFGEEERRVRRRAEQRERARVAAATRRRRRRRAPPLAERARGAARRALRSERRRDRRDDARGRGRRARRAKPPSRGRGRHRGRDRDARGRHRVDRARVPLAFTAPRWQSEETIARGVSVVLLLMTDFSCRPVMFTSSTPLVRVFSSSVIARYVILPPPPRYEHAHRALLALRNRPPPRRSPPRVPSLSRSFSCASVNLGAIPYKRTSGWSSKASVGVERRRGRGLKARGGRRETTAKVLKERRSPRERGRMGTSV